MPEQGKQRKWKVRHTVCAGKIRYSGSRQANAAVAEVRARNKKRSQEEHAKAVEEGRAAAPRVKYPGPLTVYRCTQCGWFHIGHIAVQPIVLMHEKDNNA